MTDAEKIVVFTDLDGSLLNHHDYSFDAAKPAIERLKNLHIPLILVSSKTVDEMRATQTDLQINHPFIAENGSIVAAPVSFARFIQDNPGDLVEDGKSIFCYMGKSRDEILKVLDGLSGKYDFRGFSQMGAAEIARLTGLHVRDAERSNRRLATEPIVWEDTDERWNPFCAELHSAGLRIVKGGRFHHIMGDTDKARAVSMLIDAYSRFYDATIHSIAVGDSENDLGMLNIASTAIVIPRIDGTQMQPANKERVIYANAPGSPGWRHAMENALDNWLTDGRSGGE